MKVLKFGGTSLGSPQRMKQVVTLLKGSPERKVVVLSAVSGTTNSLVQIDSYLADNKKAAAKSDMTSLRQKYLKFCDELFDQAEARESGLGVVEKEFGEMFALLDQDYEGNFEKQILAYGELLSTQLFTLYLRSIGTEVELLPALDFMVINEGEEPDLDQIKSKLGPIIDQFPGNKLFITQGFICLNHQGEIDNLRRGGSDYTASIVGAVTGADEIQIWTDIDGMHNNDPRIVPNTFPLAKLSFEEAAELAYFGAKILHPATILPAQKYQIPVRLKNTMKPEANGTIINDETDEPGVKSIAAKDGITAIKIKSSRMLLAYGFLRRIFEIFENFRTPIDLITTSEVAVSLTIDQDQNVDKITTELERFGTVFVEKDQTIVCIVGDAIVDREGIIQQIFNALNQIPLRMISYGGSRNNISILIDSKHKEKALVSLNQELFQQKVGTTA